MAKQVFLHSSFLPANEREIFEFFLKFSNFDFLHLIRSSFCEEISSHSQKYTKSKSKVSWYIVEAVLRIIFWSERNDSIKSHHFVPDKINSWVVGIVPGFSKRSIRIDECLDWLITASKPPDYSTTKRSFFVDLREIVWNLNLTEKSLGKIEIIFALFCSGAK